MITKEAMSEICDLPAECICCLKCKFSKKYLGNMRWCEDHSVMKKEDEYCRAFSYKEEK